MPHRPDKLFPLHVILKERDTFTTEADLKKVVLSLCLLLVTGIVFADDANVMQLNIKTGQSFSTTSDYITPDISLIWKAH